jgi:hypothetical protein
VRKVSQVGAEQAGIGLQVVIMERLGTAAKLAVHLAQVSQVEQLSLIRVEEGGQRAKWRGWPPEFPLLLQSRHQGRQAQLAGGLDSWLPNSDEPAGCGLYADDGMDYRVMLQADQPGTQLSHGCK